MTAKVWTMELEEIADAQSSGLMLTCKDTPVKTEDDATVTKVGVSPDGEGLSTTASPGLCQRETYCLLVQVTQNVDSVLALESKVPDHVWTELIAWDICTYWL